MQAPKPWKVVIAAAAVLFFSVVLLRSGVWSGLQAAVEAQGGHLVDLPDVTQVDNPDGPLSGRWRPTGNDEPATASTPPAGAGAATPWGAGQAATLSTTQAQEALAALPVKGKAPSTGYSRDAFGPEWADVDRNGCDTRNDILARDLDGETFKAGTHDCVVTSGVMPYEPYTGHADVRYVKGGDYANQFDIEHVLPLSLAWQMGAWQWDQTTRTQYANDPLVLFAADPSSNRAHGDKGLSGWLPPNKAFRCTYVTKVVEASTKYGLAITQADHDAAVAVLSGCP